MLNLTRKSFGRYFKDTWVPSNKKLRRIFSLNYLSDKNNHEMEAEYSYRGEISLTEKEKEIFDHLKNTVEKFNLGSTMRVAGGWVRDKVGGSSELNLAYSGTLN